MEKSQRPSNTAARLKEILQIKGWRQVDLLERIEPYCKKYNVKFPKSALSQYLSGVMSPKQDRIYILAKVFNVSEAWLMGFDVPMNRQEELKADEMDSRFHNIESIYCRLSEEGKEMLLAQAEFLLGRESETKKETGSAG